MMTLPLLAPVITKNTGLFLGKIGQSIKGLVKMGGGGSRCLSRALATAFEVVLGSPNSSYPSRRCGFERTLAHYHRPAPIHSLRRIAA